MKNRRGVWILRGILMAVVFAVVMGLVVMALWNHVAVALFGVPHIMFGQALGLLVLCRILFGGFGGWGRRGCGPGGHWHMRHKLRERWHNMTPEEREKWKNEWRSYCGPRGFRNMDEADEPSEKSNA